MRINRTTPVTLKPTGPRILLFCTEDLRVVSGTVVRARLLAEGLASQGASVGFLACGIPGCFAARGVTGFLKDPAAGFAEEIARVSGAFRPDVILGVTEAGTDWILAAARAQGRLAAFDIHGTGAFEIVETQQPGEGIQERFWNSVRWNALLPRADAVFVANPTLFPYLQQLNPAAVPLFGMTDTSHFRPDGPTVALGDPGRVQVMYAGNYFKWQGMDLFMEAVECLLRSHEPFEFTIAGSVGRDRRFVDRWRHLVGHPAVHLVDAIDHDEIPKYYRGADVFVVPRPFMISTHLAFPQKICDYMASGRPVVATDLEPHRWALSVPPSGVLCPPSGEGLAAGLRTLQDPALRATMGANGRARALELFDHRVQCRSVLQVFAGLLHPQARTTPRNLQGEP